MLVFRSKGTSYMNESIDIFFLFCLYFFIPFPISWCARRKGRRGENKATVRHVCLWVLLVLPKLCVSSLNSLWLLLTRNVIRIIQEVTEEWRDGEEEREKEYLEFTSTRNTSFCKHSVFHLHHFFYVFHRPILTKSKLYTFSLANKSIYKKSEQKKSNEKWRKRDT